MKKINTNTLEEQTWSSPKGKFGGAGKQVSEALGRDPNSSDYHLRHPFDIEITRLTPGQVAYPYHSHSAQWEFYHVISGRGTMRDDEGVHEIVAGDAFMYRPNEAHQLANNGNEDLVMYVVADNPFNDHAYYPDSKKWSVKIPQRTLVRSEPLDYFDGEE